MGPVQGIYILGFLPNLVMNFLMLYARALHFAGVLGSGMLAVLRCGVLAAGRLRRRRKSD